MKNLSNQNIQHVMTDVVDYLRFSVFDEFGVIAIDAIKGRYDSNYVGDEQDTNFRALCNELDISFDNLVRIEQQVHSDICMRIDSANDSPSRCDALIADVPGIALITREADCVPILIYDPVKKAIANVHSGWRGTVRHIVARTIEKMQLEYGSNPHDLVCALLPSIGMDHFVVHDDVREPFMREFDAPKIKDLGNGEYLIDAAASVKEDLQKAGVVAENIYDSGICTTCEADQIHSCRGGAGKKRNAALIYIKN